ncbi:MAG: hypothetical protein QOG63_1773 [Thermoleophilaceae bacterium]|nr:hypothetical protein [Thermoleophilaceae bacterium]
MKLTALTPREASIFACVCDAVVAPEPVLPPVRETDAVAFFDSWMARSPALNRVAMRGLLYALELSPLALRLGTRLRRLDRGARTRWLHAIERAPSAQVKLVVKLLKGAAQLSYYGDDRVLAICGYDAEANLRRGRALRAAEGRP